MADLDDFFAKKDRKKTKPSKKFTTTEELAKKFEEPKKTESRPRKAEPVAPVVGADGEIVPPEEQVRRVGLTECGRGHTTQPITIS